MSVYDRDPVGAALTATVDTGDMRAVLQILAASPGPFAHLGHATLADAAAAGQEGLVRLLLADGRADPAFNEYKPLFNAAGCGHVDVVTALLADPRVDATNCAADVLVAAASSRRPEVLAALLTDPRVDPASDAQKVVRWTAAWGSGPCMRVLLADHRVDPTAQQNSPIWGAARTGNHDVVQELLADERVRPGMRAESILDVVHPTDERMIRMLIEDPRVDVSLPCKLTRRSDGAGMLLLCAARWRRRRPWLRVACAV
jgi:hypothetical protein